jgi:peptide chain release factor 2
LQQNLIELNAQIEDPELWNDKNNAQKILKEKSVIEEKLNNFFSIQKKFVNQKEYLVLAKEEDDQQLINEIENDLKIIAKNSANLEIEVLFSEPTDLNNCFIDINAGAGGTDSCDFSSMLMRMYERFAAIKKFKVELINYIAGDEAGVRSATIKITGKFSFGWFKSESGVHRLVRISPFNSNGKRQTSFASVWVYPEIDDEIEIEIQEKDLRIDVFRSSGPGGQSVNTTDSAVRITHLPTNIVAQCQSDRSQIRNRAECMKMIKSRLYELEMEKKKQQLQKTENQKTDNSWGHQIRSYVMHPYQMVKDLRTDFETNNIEDVMNGEIEGFIKAALSEKINKEL